MASYLKKQDDGSVDVALRVLEEKHQKYRLIESRMFAERVRLAWVLEICIGVS